MVFEVVRGYVQLASGLSEMTRARATEVAQGLLSLPATGVVTSGQVAVQVGALAEELLVAAATNRQNLAALVRSEVDAAVSRLGLVSAEKLDESQAEVARLRAEVADLRSASSKEKTTAVRATATKTAAKKSAAKATAAKATATKTAAKKSAAKATAAKATATKTAAKKGAAKKSAAKKSAAKKSAAKTIAAEAPAAKTAVKTSTTSESVGSTRTSSAGA